jgi:hypothetical protein
MTGEWNVIEGTGIFADDNASTTGVSGLTQGHEYLYMDSV